MPVPSMSGVSWNSNQGMLTNARDMSGVRQNTGMRFQSQDDATVGYFYQRPQAESDMGYVNKRWAVGGDDSVIEQQSRNVGMQDIERDFHGLALSGRESKKLWEVETHKGGEGKMFNPHAQWTTRDDTHSWTESGENSALGNALGVNMVEYVLGGGSSPTTGKDLTRMKSNYVAGQDPGQEGGGVEKKSKTPSPFEGGVDGEREEGKDMAPNGILQNGLDDGGYRAGGNSRQTSPTTGEEGGKGGMEGGKLGPGLGGKGEMEFLPHQAASLLPQPPSFLEPQQPFDPMGLDPGGHFAPSDYSNQLSMESPNFNMDYAQMMSQTDSPNYNMDYQHLVQRQPQQPILQYALAQQQQPLGLAPTALTPAPYVLSSQDPYTLGIQLAGPAVIPQYYNVQPWLYPAAGLVQQPGPQAAGGMSAAGQQQQQPFRGQGGRPLTPSQTPDANPNSLPTQLQAPNYQILAPAYYDQNGQLVMNPRGLSGPVRLVSPAPVLVSANQQGANSALRLLTTQAQQVPTPPGVLPAASSSQQQSNTLGYNTPSSSLGYTQVTTSLFPPITTNLSLGQQQQQQQQQSFGSSGLGGLGSNPPGAIGTGQRRDSYDLKRSGMSLGGYYNPLTASPASHGGLMGGQSMTPPPSLSGSSSNLSLGLGGGGRPYSAAPGAEAKYRGGLISPANGLFSGSSLFPSRSMTSRSASLSKEVTGRSRLLEDFRNNRIPNLQLKDLVNHVVEFSQDQHGSRFIQQKLERATHQEKIMVFTEILTAAYSLMTDVFGNYVIQKFFEFGSPDQKQTLAQRVRGHVLPLALQMYGCRVIQKALESIPSDMQVEIVKELDGHVLKCVKDQNGNHVVQKCIECVDPKHLQFIIDAFKGQVYSLSTHPYGCRVIQRILEHCTLEQTSGVLEELHEHTERLVQDQYGNYVVQHVLEHGRPEDKSKIVNVIRGKVIVLSQHKFASNVVEKCVSHSSRPEKAMLIEEVCTINDGHHSALYTMMKDQFANYVVQKMIDVAEPPQRKILMHKIRPHISTLRKYTYGKHILAKLEKFFLKSNNSGDLGPIGMPPNGALP